jgi:hypothetical protein
MSRLEPHRVTVSRALVVCAAPLMAGQAEAGAWTQAPGAAFLSVSTSHYRLDDGSFEEATLALYGEYGLLERLTVGGAAEFNRPLEGDAESDLRVTGLARWRLWVGPDGDPLSVQIMAGDNLGDLVPRPQQIEDEPEVDLRLLYGRGFASPLGPGWFNAEAGPRLQLGDSADEVRVDVTLGVRPAPRWLAMVQSFNTVGLRNADPGGNDFDVYKIAPSVGYELLDGVTAVLGAEREVAGRNISRGLRVRLSLWTAF